ncbi:5-oxoprolinase subunit PxpA (plasmid) [Burkholderia cenocepacia]|uniref:5-oxoprolinase subunit PxpA n=1 Tax=Burkholderia cepacia complex TaxID=87882 RepID=UPI001BA869AD|nr:MULTISPECIES: 5-oxoprolinase subunit PxpA [Burkholderia cepacia complex]MDN7926988.1 5-oxoprolinase subunit PxpA [Burkholderia vietnamiensis]QUN41440.1 5-oxoprolinase subunit PxpA [Burkholderia cenocepacia]QUO30678.1 5-oxoprolinase subunit PxpA [Burkholderia cenocepacia]
MAAIDLNINIGEGGAQDDALLTYATSINVACGWHAGDPITMHKVATAALARDIAIGAHPSYPDRLDFGLRSLEMNHDDLSACIQYQIGALAGIVRALGGRLAHVKPHGPLYNDAEHDASIADVVANAVRRVDPSLALYGLSGGHLVAAAREAGLIAISETFADRGYRADGTLVPHSEQGAFIEDPGQIARRTKELVSAGRVQADDGSWISVTAQSLSLCGARPHAVAFAREIHAALRSASCTLRRPIWVDTNTAIP